MEFEDIREPDAKKPIIIAAMQDMGNVGSIVVNFINKSLGTAQFRNVSSSRPSFVYDKGGVLPLRINLEDVIYQQQMTSYWENILKTMIEDHFHKTQSFHAKELLNVWEKEKFCFWQVIPKEMINKFERPVLIKEAKSA